MPTCGREKAHRTWRAAGLRGRVVRLRPRASQTEVAAEQADHAARVLLSHMDLWDDLSTEDHNLLCELAPPHGPLFVWLDQQHHEHGNQAWGALREGLREHGVSPLHRVSWAFMENLGLTK